MHEHAHGGMNPTATEGLRLPLGHLPGTRYPDSRGEVLDQRFRARVGNAAVERIATGFRWAEGPVYFADGGYLLWSDIPTTASCAGWRMTVMSACSARGLATPTATPATARAG